MFKKLLLSVLIGAYSLHAGLFTPSNTPAGGIRNYAVLSNQAAVTDGEKIVWSSSSNVATPHVVLHDSGDISLLIPGEYLVQYTVRLTKTPFSGTATVVTQLQQTVSGVSSNISQSAVTTNSAIDGITDSGPSSQTQITGFAVISTTSSLDNTINLTVAITGENLTIPVTTDLDANAQLMILQLR